MFQVENGFDFNERSQIRRVTELALRGNVAARKAVHAIASALYKGEMNVQEAEIIETALITAEDEAGGSEGGVVVDLSTVRGR